MKKALIITYYWPPSGGPGVQRVLKFSKYMPHFGWQPIILTPRKISQLSFDTTLKRDIPHACAVYKTTIVEPNTLYKIFTGMKSTELIPVDVLSTSTDSWRKKFGNWIRLNLFIPDAKLFWIPFAIQKGITIIRKEKPDIIFSSSPPPTVHLIACVLAKWSKIRWVADFRDPWTRIHFYKRRSKIATAIDGWIESKILDSCDQSVCVSEGFSKRLRTSDSHNIKIIYNGFDPDDFEETKMGNERFKIVYVGGLRASRFYASFFKTLKNLLDENKLNPNRIELIVIGVVDHDIICKLKSYFNPLGVLRLKGYLSHNVSVQLMQKADLLLLFLENVDNYNGHIPAKLFEYLATGKYIMGIGDENSEAAKILSESSGGKIFSPSGDYKSDILNQYRRWKRGEQRKNRMRGIKNFSRKYQTSQLIDIFNKLQ